jgi:hypothetical protein
MYSVKLLCLTEYIYILLLYINVAVNEMWNKKE